MWNCKKKLYEKSHTSATLSQDTTLLLISIIKIILQIFRIQIWTFDLVCVLCVITVSSACDIISWKCTKWEHTESGIDKQRWWSPSSSPLLWTLLGNKQKQTHLFNIMRGQIRLFHKHDWSKKKQNFPLNKSVTFLQILYYKCAKYCMVTPAIKETREN